MTNEPFYVPMYYEDESGPQELRMACYPWRQCVNLYDEWKEACEDGNVTSFAAFMEHKHLRHGKTAEQKIEAVRKVIDTITRTGKDIGSRINQGLEVPEDSEKVMHVYANIAELLKRAIED